MGNFELTYTSDNGRSVTFGGPPYWLKSVTGIHGLENTIYDFAQYRQDGTTIKASRLNPRDIGISYRIVEDVVPNRIKLLNAIDPKRAGTLTLSRGDDTWRIGCVVKQAPMGLPADGSEGALILYAPDPYWRADAEAKTDIAVWEPMFEWELVIPIDYGVDFGLRTQERVVNVYNEGAADVGMRIRFTANGTLSNPSLIQAETFERIKLNLSMVSGDVVEVQTTQSQQYVRWYHANGTVENAFWAWDVDNTFLQLLRGDNLFRFDADTGVDRLDVSVYYDVAYLGV